MAKKLAIIGRGTAGCMAAIHFNRWTDWDIDWYYDPVIKPTIVGEGSNLRLPMLLKENIDFFYDKLFKLDGTLKTGLRKVNWGNQGGDFLHLFPPPYVGYHFHAVKLQDYIIEYLSNNNSRIKRIEQNVSDPENLDADYVLVCTGRQTDLTNYQIAKHIPVNAVRVRQCYWDQVKFNYTLTMARPYGWVFGIPLQNRCAIGYVYNRDFNSIEQVKEDVENVYNEFDLVPSNDGVDIPFINYYKKQNFSNRVIYNGNASFFFEPLEATAQTMIEQINRAAFDMWESKSISVEQATTYYFNNIREIEHMILLHYYAGSKFQTPFWEYAKSKGQQAMEEAVLNPGFRHKVIDKGLKDIDLPIEEYGTWPRNSYLKNLREFGKLKELSDMAIAAENIVTKL
jgi:hypothetical protein